MEPRAREHAIVAAVSALLSAGFVLLHWSRGEILLYGDALAHINIARRVFDSLTPGLGQLGTPWLPLPHLLMMPFLASDRLWQSGLGAAIPSMGAYVLAVLGVYRLLRKSSAVLVAALAAAIVALNPNLLYLQTTAMTEPLALALFIWAVVYFSEFRQAAPYSSGRPLVLCGLCLAALMLTRYDGWFYAPMFVAAAMLLAPRRVRVAPAPFLIMVLLPALAAVAWLAYNQVYFGDALEFARGPHSASAIAQRTSPAYSGKRDLLVSAIYYQKAAKLNLSEGVSQHLLMLLAAAGALLAAATRRHAAWLLLWLPLPVYTLSLAHGHVPIFLPDWYPHNYYNLRYGVHLLPAVAVFSALLVGRFSMQPWRNLAAGVLAVLVSVSYVSVWRAQPITLREARVNTVHKNALEQHVSKVLAQAEPGAMFLMYSGTHPGAVQRAGIAWRRVITEGNHGIWEQALEAPAQHADYVVAVEGDPVWEAIERRPEGLVLIARIEAGSHRAAVFRARSRRSTIQPLSAEHPP